MPKELVDNRVRYTPIPTMGLRKCGDTPVDVSFREMITFARGTRGLGHRATLEECPEALSISSGSH
jgi:hypothetical protein